MISIYFFANKLTIVHYIVVPFGLIFFFLGGEGIYLIYKVEEYEARFDSDEMWFEWVFFIWILEINFQV